MYKQITIALFSKFDSLFPISKRIAVYSLSRDYKTGRGVRTFYEEKVVVREAY